MSLESLIDDWDRLVAEEEQLGDEYQPSFADSPVVEDRQQVGGADKQTITAPVQACSCVEQPQSSVTPSISGIVDDMTALPVVYDSLPPLPVQHDSLQAVLTRQHSMQAFISNDSSIHSVLNDHNQHGSFSNDNDMSLFNDMRIDTDIGQQQASTRLTGSGVSSVATSSVDGPNRLAKAYMESLNMQSSLHVIAEANVVKAYEDSAEYGLFSLFFTAMFRHSLQTWTSEVLTVRGKAKLTESEFNTYCGLEIAMSICALNEISEYWSDSRFLGQEAFIETMPRTCFQDIRAALQFHPPDDPTLEKLHGPLWHSRTLLAHFQNRFAEFAVPPPRVL